VKRKEREAGTRAGREVGPRSAGWADAQSAGEKKTGWAKRPPGRGQGWCFSFFFIPFPKPFLNIILMQNNFKPKANNTK
jgi:hypothetical protein